ncbi:MAG: DNA mismatch repair endonuclease MutL [Clostridiales bacterium]|jgi:DNA mismatch repair protein MutL|nr:DNA mismatch repair endonuclease MutL [Clostridiales bacterium]
MNYTLFENHNEWKKEKIMPDINILDSSVYNKISAGEVIERPRSVVKELVENAVDAGATLVTVEISGGGIRSVRVSDNGFGIDEANLKKAFLPHATSKILRAEDLETISSLGFRGEALASIAAVGIVEIVSKTDAQDAACKMEVKDGIFGEITYTAANRGTSITVNDLFYNAKPRLNFLKRPKTEENYISALMAKFITAYPDISFTYKADGEIVYKTSGAGLENAVYEVYGRELSDNLMSAEYYAKGSILRGYISIPGYYKSNKTYQTVFVNGRIVESALISAAVSKAYGENIMKHCFPIFILDIILPFDTVDANAHPTKNEVRFADDKEVFSFVFRAVRERVNLFIANGEKKSAPLTDENDVNDEDEYGRNRNEKSENGDEGIGWTDAKGASGVNETNGTERIAAKGSVRIAGQIGNKPPYNVNLDAVKRFGRGSLSFGALRNSAKNRLNDNASPIAIPRDFFTDYGCNNTDSDYNAAAENGGKIQERSGSNTAYSENAGGGAAVKNDGIGIRDAFGQKRTHTENADAFGGMNNYNSTGAERSNGEVLADTDISAAYGTPPKKTANPNALDFIKHGRRVGQVLGCYIIFEYFNEVYLVDQHAIHERVNYDRLKSRQRTANSQIFLEPYIFRVNHAEKNIIDGLREYLAELGFDIEYFGGSDYKISAAPVDVDLKKFIADLLSEVRDTRQSRDYLEEKIIQTACKSSIKSGDVLNDAQLGELVGMLKNLDIAPTCPHGRPVFVKLTKTELDKMFKRII